MTDNDEDWFESAVSDEDDAADEAEDAASEHSEEEISNPTGEGSIGDTETEEVIDESAEIAGDPGSAEDTSGNQADGETGTFETGFGTAFRNAPDPGVAGEESGGSLAGGSDDPGDEFGFGSGDESFDEEEFESDIDRVDIGIEGLDQMILGGVPRRSLMVAIGSAGTGKTTFGMEFLRTALEDGDNAVYISLEESRERILDTADEKGWEFSRYEEAGQLAIVNFDPVEMANALSSIQNELPRLIAAFDADRLVLDSVSLLEMMYDEPSKRRDEVFDFARSLKEAGVTTFVTSEASEDNPYSSRYGIVEYLADAVFVLQYVRPSDFRETRLAIAIQKIRDANHSRETKPYEITGDGISVYRQANIF